MASIVVLTHEYDRFAARHYLVQGLFPHWIEAGHFVVVHAGDVDPPPADVAILHVDLTVVPESYRRALERYPVVVNGGTWDISKRVVSAGVVAPGDGYDGPVIVKTNLNCAGYPEAFHAAEAARRGRPVAVPPRVLRGRYPVFATRAAVPAEVWSDPELVPERFLPERGERGYYLRSWVFFGDRERCTRWLGAHPVVKAADVVERTPVPVPDELRALRERFGFGYGKFDFALHEGRPVLYDVNRTPTVPENLDEILAAGMADLAPGLDAFLGRAPSAR